MGPAAPILIVSGEDDVQATASPKMVSAVTTKVEQRLALGRDISVMDAVGSRGPETAKTAPSLQAESELVNEEVCTEASVTVVAKVGPFAYGMTLAIELLYKSPASF